MLIDAAAAMPPIFMLASRLWRAAARFAAPPLMLRRRFAIYAAACRHAMPPYVTP